MEIDDACENHYLPHFAHFAEQCKGIGAGNSARAFRGTVQVHFAEQCKCSAVDVRYMTSIFFSLEKLKLFSLKVINRSQDTSDKVNPCMLYSNHRFFLEY